MIINTLKDEIDDSMLIKREGVVQDDDDFHVEAVEYCLKECVGQAHVTGVADSLSHFCDLHVHRSVHATAKRFPPMAGTAASLG